MNELEGEEGPRRRDRSQEDCVPAQRQKKREDERRWQIRASHITAQL